MPFQKTTPRLLYLSAVQDDNYNGLLPDQEGEFE